jgi:signal transduction histidine kinase
VPALAVLAVAALLYPVRDRLPTLIDPAGLKALEEANPGGFPVNSVSPLSVLVGALTAVLLLAAALAYRQAYVRNGPVSEGYLSVALIVAAFSVLLHGFYPSVYTGLVTSEYFLRLISYGVLLLGIYAEQRGDLRALRLAYAGLDRLRVTESERAALEERSRLAREIHDGLAQHLWFAKLKFERLVGQLPEDDRPLAGEVGQALDSAIVEARQAMVTMRTSIDQDLPLAEMIRRVVDDFAQRSGLRVEYQADPTVPSAILPRQQIELLRIVQEALTNIRKHADATVVRVRAHVNEGNLVVTIGDNGKGFETGTAREQGLGIVGMEERARLMGGQFHVTAAPSDGTLVEVLLPLLSAGSVDGVDPIVAAALAQTPPFGTPIVQDPGKTAPPVETAPQQGARPASAGSLGSRS